MATHSSTLAWKSHGWRSLIGCSPWGLKESDMTEWLHFHFSLSCIGEGDGNPLQCSCLENPRYGGALWAAISGVAQSRTRLKQLSCCCLAARHCSLLKVQPGDSLYQSLVNIGVQLSLMCPNFHHLRHLWRASPTLELPMASAEASVTTLQPSVLYSLSLFPHSFTGDMPRASPR